MGSLDCNSVPWFSIQGAKSIEVNDFRSNKTVSLAAAF